MKRYTNKYDLPETIVRAVSNDTHPVGGDISVTQLIDSPKIRILKKKHKEEIQEDVSDMLYALMGTALHHIIERGDEKYNEMKSFLLVAAVLRKNAGTNEKFINAAKFLENIAKEAYPESGNKFIYEKTLRMEVAVGDVKKILYGTFDLYDREHHILHDYKFCSVYQYLYEESRHKWYAQLNVYARMLEANGYPVKEIRITAFFRDWDRFNKHKDYPPRQIMTIEVPMKPANVMDAYIKTRFEMHINAENGELYECSGKERWASSTQYAAKTHGSTKAIKVFNSEDAYQDFALREGHNYNGLFLEVRNGVSKRCESYCPVNKFCEQYKKENNGKN
jgi:hypothetical protein